MMGESDPLLVGNMSNDNNTDEASMGEFCTKLACRVGVVFLCVVVIISLFDMSFVVPPGMVGIAVTLGHVEAFSSGLHFRIPWVSHVEILSAKTQLLEDKNIIPTKEGLSVTLDTAVLFRLDAAKAATLYRQVGSNYIEVLIKPEAASAVRGLTSESEAKALYSSGRNLIQDALKEELTTKLGPRGIIIEDVLLKDIVLPAQLSKSIELKVQAEQDASRMEFVLQKELQEAKRKAIEAGGIADFQRIVSDGISPQLLKWKGIEATEKFAESPNTKIVIMGNDAGGLPVILSAEADRR
jgi:regulator of protease activity HflC (stomatin/prohibitin superfamily)